MRGDLLEPGLRNRKVTIQQAADSVATTGFPVETWTTLADVWMSREDMTMRERSMADQLSAKADSRWQMPYRSDMDPELLDIPKVRRLSYQGRLYDIVSASLIGQRAGVELTTLAKVG
jgi:SPP1 family predicted phage head-tail adaptor